jgi:tryptophan halogenase
MIDRSETQLDLLAGLRIVTDPAGLVYVCSEHRLQQLIGARAEHVQAILALARVVRDPAELRARVAADIAASRAYLDSLVDALLTLARSGAPGAPPTGTRKVALVGNGALLRLLADLLAALPGYEFRAHRWSGPGGLDTALTGCELVVCALERLPAADLVALEQIAGRLGLPCLLCTAGASEAVLGPLLLPGAGPCAACRELDLRTRDGASRTQVRPFVTQLPAPQLPASGIGAALGAALGSALLDALGSYWRARDRRELPPLAGQALRIDAGGGRRAVQLTVDRDCPHCSAGRDDTSRDGILARCAEVSAIGERWTLPPEPVPASGAGGYRSVVVVGGGTAGYLTALGLRRRLPHLSVTLVESSRIPVIGVGEASTPELVKFLHSPRFLGRDIGDFFARVRPSLKLGIRFFWGAPGESCFNFPFQRGRMLESLLYGESLEQQSLGSLLMTRQRAPMLRAGDGSLVSLLSTVRTAYHLDNRRFVRYLQEEAAAAGIHQVDAVVADLVQDASGDVQALVCDDGRRIGADLFVDCTGFRSLLIERLGVPFLGYESSLFTDRAVVADVPHDGQVAPYTHAESMDAGWCWNIPFEEENHRGYVFSSRFLGFEQAAAEMRRKNPGMREPREVRFRSGRRRQFWCRNVVAMGNAYAFVEPLESTAIHMLVLMIDLLTSHFPAARHDTTAAELLDQRVADHWDDLRWFLAIHYRFNRKFDTPFWRAARGDTDISGARQRLALYRAGAPLSYRLPLLYRGDPASFFSDDHAYDTLLLGQGVEARWAAPTLSRDVFLAQAEVQRQVADRALPQAEFLRAMRDDPEPLRALVRDPDSWINRWNQP